VLDDAVATTEPEPGRVTEKATTATASTVALPTTARARSRRRRLMRRPTAARPAAWSSGPTSALRAAIASRAPRSTGSRRSVIVVDLQPAGEGLEAPPHVRRNGARSDGQLPWALGLAQVTPT